MTANREAFHVRFAARRAQRLMRFTGFVPKIEDMTDEYTHASKGQILCISINDMQCCNEKD